MNQNFDTIIDVITEQDPRYKDEAYFFVMDALNYTQKKFRCEKHVSGKQLLAGLRDMLIQKFGPMTLTVLEYWGVKSTEDFGNIVFNLVENNVLSRTEDDQIEQFKDVYDFQEVFQSNYRKLLNKKISRMRSI